MTTNYIKKSGDIGIAVNKIQGYLNIFQNQGCIKSRVLQDGVFGSDTKMAVQQFQRYSNLPVDGIIGEKTWNSMMSNLKKMKVIPRVPVVSSSYQLKYNQIGIDVFEMQGYLNLFLETKTAFPKMKEDGNYGEKTKQAVIYYQRYYHLEIDGIIKEYEWDMLVKDYLHD